MSGDMTCLAEGLVVPANFDKTGLNLNQIVVGPTGCGKSYSNAYSRMLYTYESSMVVPVTKKDIVTKFSAMFKSRGYEVVILDFVNPKRSSLGYDPLDYIKSDEDIMNLAKHIIEGSGNMYRGDEYWNNSSSAILAALIGLVMLNAKYAGKKACFADVIELQQLLITDSRDLSSTNLDVMFERAEKLYPGNQASRQWKTIFKLSNRTTSCILSIVNCAIMECVTPAVLDLTRKKQKIDLEKIGQRKTAVFIITSPINKALHAYVNIMYGDMFRILFEAAESNKNGRLRIPVHILCDDFATGSKIVDFEDYISIFRAAGISVTLLLQSESQLINMYGESASTTIVNNCDTYVYMGGMDVRTCQSISIRINKPVHKVMSLPREQVIVFRRGEEPFYSRRYQILDDPVYKEVMGVKQEDISK